MRRILYISIVILLAGCAVKPVPETTMAPGGVLFDIERVKDPVTGEVPSHLRYHFNGTIMGQGLRNKATKYYPNTWYPIDDKFANLAITQVVYDPSNTSTFYFCTGEGFFNADAVRGAGVWKSTNAGETWVQLSATQSDDFWYCQDMVVHPSGDVYVATRSAGVMRSQDGGQTWEQVIGFNNGSQISAAADLEINSDGDIIVAFGLVNAGDGIYLSTTGDAGDWKRISDGLPSSDVGRFEFGVAKTNPDVMYCVPHRRSDYRVHGVFKTVDRGQQWTQISSPGGNENFAARQSWYDLIVQVDPNNEDVVAIGALNVWRSTDGGDNWQQLFEGRSNRNSALQYVHVDQHNIVFQDSDTVYFTNDGGVWKTDHFTADTPLFYSLNANYNTTQYYSCDIAPLPEQHMVLGGTQDNGSSASTGSGISEFDEISWADGSYCAIDHENGEYLYTTTQYARIFRTHNGKRDTLTNPYITDGDNGSTLFINPIHMDVNDPGTIYQATNEGLWALFNSRTAKPEDWKQVSNRIYITAIGTSRAAENVVFTVRGNVPCRVEDVRNGDVNNRAILMDRNGELPLSAYLNCIVPDDQDSNHVILIYSNYGVVSIFETFNAFDLDPDWRSCEGNLPNIPVRWGCFKNGSSSVFYVATEVGVFHTDSLNGDSTVWVENNENLPRVRVDMIKSRVSDDQFVVGTHGRGIWTGFADSTNHIIWNERGPSNVGGRTRTLMIDPNDPTKSKVWAGSVSGGLWAVNDIDSTTYFELQDFGLTLDVYPNPTNELHFKTIEGSTEDLIVEVYNNLGKKVWRQRYEYNAITTLRLDGLANGILYVRLKQGEEVVVKKIIKSDR